jgi:uncharacterized membrane-anchored protein YhcB (DUF1043 family)
LAYILIGWIFSIYWGILIVRKSWHDKQELQNFLDLTGPRSDQQQQQYQQHQQPPVVTVNG